LNGLIAAGYALWKMTSSPLRLQKANQTPGQADEEVTALRDRAKQVDANDMLYQFDASGDYNPAPGRDQGAAMGDQFGR
jgi:homoserine O-acetyltransferase